MQDLQGAAPLPPHADQQYVLEPLVQARRMHSTRAWLKAIDLAVYREIRMLAHRPPQVAAARRYSQTGSHGALWIGLGLAAGQLDSRRRRAWRRGALTVAAAEAISTGIKVAVGRQRPAVEDLPHLMATPTGLSFPSSHAASAFAAARVFGGLAPAGPLYTAAGAMALSRVYLGVHYPSDIAAGALLGLVIGSVGRSGSV